MALFVCDECDTIENTALGLYWRGHRHEAWFGIPNHSALCSACMPTHFLNGSKHRTGKGEWHGEFARETFANKPDTDVINRPKEE